MSPTNGIIGEATRLYREHWIHLLSVAAVVYLVVAGITLVGVLAFGALGGVLGALLSFIGSFWTEAALVEAVRDIRDGRADLSVGQTFRGVSPRLGAVI